MSRWDWTQIRRQVRRAGSGWYLLGDELPYSLAEALRQEKITAMRGLSVRTRNNIRDDRGHRVSCSIYLREGKHESDPHD